ncbi:response regulator transcription factor [Flavihumibacter sp. CACIAM 22H1]|uniref:response regulator transcription factor n=1 Tax=Flavihumibacter sp. CACIAM 22H1 TaxID=1812911 RepID=UPI0007A91AD4|nr:response regulator transcription factor [Flavihumibacter sp. CACIAM 22H1]KYP15359.1 MAG: two-component system response regulator [Flavihumibacter sp. CACIAM 22H1]
MQHKVLFVEDEIDLGNVVKQYLQLMDLEIDWHTTAEDAYLAFTKNKASYDLLMIDVQLPGADGFELAKKFYQLDSKKPFLFLTARNEKKDRLRGLELGADDYISKPFDIDELVLRIRNIIRRNKRSETTYKSATDLKIGDIILHKDLFKLSIRNFPGKGALTPREMELLEFLYKHRNSVLKREDILLQLWGENDYFLGRSLDVFISRLRKLLSASTKVKIENVYGVGFIFTVQD